MEYLSRILDQIRDYVDFRYHPLCGRIKLNHLAFADDLLLFCRGDKQSITGLLRAFESFSRASGLRMNKGKSSIYSNGVDKAILDEVSKVTGMVQGSLPFKYLRIPIAARKLSVLECSTLVDKVSKRIRALGCRKLSYAGRLVLIQSVLSNLHSYWARIFVLPTAILKQITSICRNFLWTGLDNANGNALVSWDQICNEKKHGGLGIKDLIQWNKATLGKYIWWVAQKKDHLWVRWVHSVYIKAGSWQQYNPQLNGSWAWRKLCRIKELFAPGYIGDWWLHDQNHYSIQSGYEWLKPHPAIAPWFSFTWVKEAVPRHNFIGWLIANERLLTRDRLHRMGITSDVSCVLCENAQESHDYLFFKCTYSRRCLDLVAASLGCNLPCTQVSQWWLQFPLSSVTTKHQVAASLLALMYSLWWARNTCRIQAYLPRPEFLIKQISTSNLLIA